MTKLQQVIPAADRARGVDRPSRARWMALVLPALALAAGGCKTREFLSRRRPSDFVSPVNFYQNAGDALSAVTSAYATFVDLPSPQRNSD